MFGWIGVKLPQSLFVGTDPSGHGFRVGTALIPAILQSFNPCCMSDRICMESVYSLLVSFFPNGHGTGVLAKINPAG